MRRGGCVGEVCAQLGPPVGLDVEQLVLLTPGDAVNARRWRADGIIRPIGDRHLADLVQAVWILAETWFALLELDNPDPAPDDGARLLHVALAPYLV